jgi:hypothetical protein
VTQKKLLYAFEGVFLIRLCKIEGDRKGHTVFFEDQGEHYYLTKNVLSTNSCFLGFCYRNIRAQFQYRLGEPFSIHQYRSKAGAVVPIVFRSTKGALGVMPVWGGEISRKDVAAGQSFLRRNGNAKMAYVHSSRMPPKIIDERSLFVSAQQGVL